MSTSSSRSTVTGLCYVESILIRLPTTEATYGLGKKKHPVATSRSSCGVMTIRAVLGMANVHMPDAMSSWPNKIRSMHVTRRVPT